MEGLLHEIGLIYIIKWIIKGYYYPREFPADVGLLIAGFCPNSGAVVGMHLQ